MNQAVFTLLLGLILGIKHAFDADHLVAVSTMVSDHQNPYKAALVGSFWGIGHTSTLFLTGALVLLLKVSIPEHISLSFELLVGFMLVFLGIRTILSYDNILVHTHPHQSEAHMHPQEEIDKKHRHGHKRSFLIGSIHGLAGSGALVILVLTTIRSTLEGIFYILIFGVGSIIGMTLMSMVFGFPFILSKKKFPGIDRYLKKIVGVLSIIFGLSIIYKIGFVEGVIFKLLNI